MNETTFAAFLIAVFATGMTTTTCEILGVVPRPDNNDADVFITIGGIDYKVCGNEVSIVKAEPQEATPDLPPALPPVCAGNEAAGFEKPAPVYAAPAPALNDNPEPTPEPEVAPEPPPTAEQIDLRFSYVMTLLGANDIVATGVQRENGEDVFNLVNAVEDGIEIVVASGTLNELEKIAADKMHTPIDENAEIPSIAADVLPAVTPEVFPDPAGNTVAEGEATAPAADEEKAGV